MFPKAITKNLIFYFMFVRTVSIFFKLFHCFKLFQTISMLHLPCVDLMVHSINQPYQQAAHWIVWFFLDPPSNPMPPMGHHTHPLKMIPRNQKIRNCLQYLCFTRETKLEKGGRNATKLWFSYLEHSKFCKEKETICGKIYHCIID